MEALGPWDVTLNATNQFMLQISAPDRETKILEDIMGSFKVNTIGPWITLSSKGNNISLFFF
jgi:hypothetical protein